MSERLSQFQLDITKGLPSQSGRIWNPETYRSKTARSKIISFKGHLDRLKIILERQLIHILVARRLRPVASIDSRGPRLQIRLNNRIQL